MKSILPVDEIRRYIGREIGTSQWLKIDQGRIDRFADCTEDRQWIHVDPYKAAHGPYGTTVAHGFLIISLIPHLCRDMTISPQGAPVIVNYGCNRVRFITPVPAGAFIRDRMFLKDLTEKNGGNVLMTMEHIIEIQGVEEPACVVETLRLFVPAPE
jgi:acyl dehydratase